MLKHMLISLAAFAGFAASAYAQPHPPHHPVFPVHPAPAHPGPNAVTGVGGANQDVLRRPRFIVEAVSFKAVNESGIDWPYSSDEVVAEFSDLTSGRDGQHYYMRTHEFDQVDSGDTRQFPYNESCIVGVAAPTSVHHNTWLCDPHGAQAPLTFRIELWDSDSALSELPFPGFCVSGITYGPDNDGVCYGNQLFGHTFTYTLSQVMPRINNSCRCFTETADLHADGRTEYQVTFRVTRVDDNGPPLTLSPDEGPAPGPTVLHSGSLTAHTGQAFELDNGAVANNGDFDFDRRNGVYELDAPGSNGASIWIGGASPRGFAACNAQRGTANYVSSAVTVPPNGSYACYVTDDGHVGEMRIDNLSTAAQTLTITYTTWQ